MRRSAGSDPDNILNFVPHYLADSAVFYISDARNLAWVCIMHNFPANLLWILNAFLVLFTDLHSAIMNL